ncbi:MAG TPA: hypothetical protein VGI45_00205 [Terracidiphilus sp.]|jgi:hypothetical protein
MRFQPMMRFAGAFAFTVAVLVAPWVSLAQGGDTVLKPSETQKLLPASVYYKAQSAPTQLRNSTGIKFSDGYYVLSTLVDTSGYSSDIQAKYQAYFITEVPLKFGSENLPAGVYGVGFVGGKFVVTDVGAHDIFSAQSSTDDGIKRPMPLQIMADPTGGFRLYAGRKFVKFAR